MQKKNIFKTVALAMLMPAMLLTTACSSEDDVANINNEPTVKKGYALPVTVNVTRQGDATTRATYTDNGDGTGSLAFGDGDKLFVRGDHYVVGKFAGTLTWQSGGTFSGTIYTESPYEGTADALFSAASDDGSVNATLLPAGYGSYGYLVIKTNDSDAQYDDYVEVSNEYTLATSKADGVAQFSYETVLGYSSGFALSRNNAILNFTITGLAASTDVDVSLTSQAYNITGTVTTDASGTATFAAGITDELNLQPFSLTVGGNAITLPDKDVEAGKIYNIARNAIPGALIGQFSVSDTKKVYFSKGNLQATTTDMGTSWTWAFAEHQWSYVGYAAPNGAIIGNKTVSENGTVDLFGWSTAENYLGIHYSDDGYNSGDFVDWGSHADVTAGIGSDWCTLSKDEWHYLFYTRSVSTVGGTENGRYAKAKVNNVQGVILFPDTYTHPDGVTAPTGVNATDDTGWNGNNYSSADWTKMEKNGAVFLPAAGYRNWGAEVYEVGTDGYYWSSSANGDEDAHYVYFNSDDLVVDEYSTSRYCGHSVRLVRPVQ